ncbi:MAG: FAD:protein FMN transferase [Armatimonadota bacterium]
MGVQVRIVVYAPDAEQADRACEASFRRIAALEDVMSDYRPESELMRLCAQAGGPPVHVSDDLFRVLERSQALSRLTQGAFDVTAGPFVRLWRTARRTGHLPSRGELEKARARVGWRKMRLDSEARTVELTVPGMMLDLGGIAKGYALDCALATLRRHGIERALIEAGGDIILGDPPPGRAGWRILIPHATPERQRVTFSNAAVSTSGDTRQYARVEGGVFSHIVDPRVGLRRAEPIVATVIGPDATTTDALATAACVLGRRRATEIVGAVADVTVYVRHVGGESD